MSDQDRSARDPVHLTPDQARDTVAEAARHYFESRRGRVDAFVDRHFSLSGALALHRKALGWDVLKVPANILLAIPTAVSSWVHSACRRPAASRLRTTCTADASCWRRR